MLSTRKPIKLVASPAKFGSALVFVSQYLWKRPRTATLFRIGFSALVIGAEPAAAARSGWLAQERSQVRLLLSPAADGTLAGGVDISLDPGWYTYWRTPGDAGVPPVFDFSRSENVANVKVGYPAPERHQGEGGTSLIYRDEVVFPLVVKPVRPDAPVTLRLHGSFGVCREICLPVAVDAEVALRPGSPPDPLSDALLQRFGSRVPGPPDPDRFAVQRIAVAGDALDIAVRMPDSSVADLFAEPPSGWYLGQPAFVSRDGGVSHYRLALEGAPRGADVGGQRFRFVAVAGGRAIEQEAVINR